MELGYSLLVIKKIAVLDLTIVSYLNGFHVRRLRQNLS